MIYLRNITNGEVEVFSVDGDSMVLVPRSLTRVDNKFGFKLDPKKVRIVDVPVDPVGPIDPGIGTGGTDNLPTNIPANSILGTGATPDIIQATPIADGEVVGRQDGNLVGIKISDLRVDVDTIEKVNNLIRGNMHLITTDTDPDDDSIEVYINGISLARNFDFDVNGRVMTATVHLNESYGGTGTDGLGFDDSDECRVVYRVKND